ncbi:hypothetical protein GJ744_009869 [Endocarpon pusillum]|uniref:Uncharacterized protein n=1 Tax=Endocarpon pusillum TaxID=364733 RepID=A0A8H7E3G0_9EURO|nr:hypothetical protein GJ744_009869 [Endocarpon pusillum]
MNGWQKAMARLQKKSREHPPEAFCDTKPSSALSAAPFHPASRVPSRSTPEGQIPSTELIKRSYSPEEYRAIATNICIFVFAETLILLLLDEQKFLDTIFCILFFIPYPFWFSRVAVLVPLLASPPHGTKVSVILLLMCLHRTSRYHSKHKTPTTSHYMRFRY